MVNVNVVHAYFALDDQLTSLEIKREYIQLVGDLKATSLLAQLLCWYRPSDGKTKPKKPVLKNGYYWAVNNIGGWMEDCALTRAEYYSGVKTLIDKGLVVKAVHKFTDGNPAVWMRLDLDLLYENMCRLQSGLPLVWKPCDTVENLTTGHTNAGSQASAVT